VFSESKSPAQAVRALRQVAQTATAKTAVTTPFIHQYQAAPLNPRLRAWSTIVTRKSPGRSAYLKSRPRWRSRSRAIFHSSQASTTKAIPTARRM
jgi:hypothetical protein